MTPEPQHPNPSHTDRGTTVGDVVAMLVGVAGVFGAGFLCDAVENRHGMNWGFAALFPAVAVAMLLAGGVYVAFERRGGA